MKPRQDIQILRGFAVLGVLLFHLNPKIFPSGFLGVDVFFVISGYLLTPSIEQIVMSNKSNLNKMLRAFYLRRFARLTPALITVVVLFSLWMLIFGPLGEQRYAYIQGLTALINLANVEAFRLSQGSYFHPDPNGLLHTWSLSAEEQVFILLPISLIFLHKILRVSFKRSVLLLFALGSIYYFLVNLTIIFSTTPFFFGNRDFYYFSPIFRATEFLIGSLLVNHFKYGINYSHGKIAVLNLSLLTILLTPITNKFLLPVSIFLTSLILVNSRGSMQANWVYTSIVKIGDASYSIYLFHLPVIYIIKHIASEFDFNSWIVALLSVTITLMIGHVSYKSIELSYKAKIVVKTTKFKMAQYLSILVVATLLIGGLRVGATRYYGLATPPTIAGTISCTEGNNSGYCGKLSSERKQNFILIGDSHAAALSEVFMDEIEKHGGNPIVMYGRGCPLSVQNYNLSERALTPCQEYIQKVRNFLLENRATIVVAQRSSQEMWPDQSSIKNEISAINFLSKFADKIYVISPNPEFRKGLSQGSTSSLLKTEAKTPISHMMHASFSNFRLLQASLKSPQIELYDSTKLFCSAGWCEFKRAGQYLYWDSNHLSREGAKLYRHFFSTLVRHN